VSAPSRGVKNGRRFSAQKARQRRHAPASPSSTPSFCARWPLPHSEQLQAVCTRFLPSSGLDFPYFELSGPASRGCVPHLTADLFNVFTLH
jgi:hypothetical protein